MLHFLLLQTIVQELNKKHSTEHYWPQAKLIHSTHPPAKENEEKGFREKLSIFGFTMHNNTEYEEEITPAEHSYW